MDHHDALMVGMFWAGLLVAAVPMLLTLGIGVYVLRRYLEERRRPDHRSPDLGTRRRA